MGASIIVQHNNVLEYAVKSRNDEEKLKKDAVQAAVFTTLQEQARVKLLLEELQLAEDKAAAQLIHQAEKNSEAAKQSVASAAHVTPATVSTSFNNNATSSQANNTAESNPFVAPAPTLVPASIFEITIPQVVETDKLNNQVVNKLVNLQHQVETTIRQMQAVAEVTGLTTAGELVEVRPAQQAYQEASVQARMAPHPDNTLVANQLELVRKLSELAKAVKSRNPSSTFTSTSFILGGLRLANKGIDIFEPIEVATYTQNETSKIANQFLNIITNAYAVGQEELLKSVKVNFMRMEFGNPQPQRPVEANSFVESYTAPTNDSPWSRPPSLFGTSAQQALNPTFGSSARKDDKEERTYAPAKNNVGSM